MRAMKKNYYRDLDIIRVISCIGVLLYHLNILKGGYLAVCIFFVLTGYLSCISALKKDKFSLKEYYKNRLIHIYLPLVIVVFLSIYSISFFKNINWVNLKPETTSVLLGYNNYWQIGANLDYFARHVSSPFMHFWYIGILLQFDLVFPFIFMILKRIGDKTKKFIPIIITLLLTIISTAYFYYMSVTSNIMSVYYDTLCRIFSIMFGLALGIVTSNYKKLIPDKFSKSPINRIIFYLYLIILCISFIFISSTSKFFAIAMILTSIITCRLIDYGTLLIKDKLNIFDKVIKYIASISYEIYLVQYPVIFIFQYIDINIYLKVLSIILITIISSCIIHYGLSIKKLDKKSINKFFVLTIISYFTLIGAYQYVIAKDHTEEMKALEEQMSSNQSMMKEKQEAYLKARENANNEFQNALNDLNKSEEELSNDVKNMPVVGVGDSVMLGALNSLYNMFPNGYFDAKVSRTDYEANRILEGLSYSGMLGNPIIINLGTNGQCGERCRLTILNTCGDRQIFWVNVTNDLEVHVNADLASFAERNSNVHLVDWNTASYGHYDWFVADGIHLTSVGTQNYARILYENIYNYYLEDFNIRKQKLLDDYENNINSKFTFYGNELLLNAYNDIQVNNSDANYNIDEEYDYSKLTNKIQSDITTNNITKNIVLVFDDRSNLTNEEYNNIINLLGDRNIYIVKANNNININNDKVTIIDFYKELSKHKDYIMVDKVHLSSKGNIALSKLIDKSIKK